MPYSFFRKHSSRCGRSTARFALGAFLLLSLILVQSGSAAVPTITSISPTSASSGDPGFTLTVNGTDFVNGSVVLWGGADRQTTLVSSTQLTAQISASDIAVARTVQVTVGNPSPGGGISNAVVFTVNTGASTLPFITDVAPSSVIAGGPAFTLTVTGANFSANSVVRWNAQDRATTYISSSELRAAILATDIAQPWTVQVIVFTPGATGGLSNAVRVTIEAVSSPVPLIGTLGPARAAAGTSAFSLTVNGANFVPRSQVYWNGLERTTTYLGVSQLTAAITAEDVAAAGTAQVHVTNPAPGGGISNVLTFTVDTTSNPAPRITSIAPSNAVAGAAGFPITVYGSDFVAGSTVRWNGSTRTTVYLSGTQLRANVPASDLAAAGAAQITVFNPGPSGGTSNTLNFSVIAGSNPVPTLAALAPSSAAAFTIGFPLFVNGSNFVAGAVVRWNGSERSTTFISPTQLRALILNTDVMASGTAEVTAVNPGPGGGASNGLAFTINSNPNLLPAIVSVLPPAATAGGTGFTLIVEGANFAAGSTVRWAGVDRETTFLSSTKLFAQILASDIASAGMPVVTVYNPPPGGGSSNMMSFDITSGNNPIPQLFSMSPASATAGTAGLTLIAIGGPFVAGSVVRWNGADRDTLYLSTGQLSATILPNDLIAAGSAQVTAFNPAPRGGESILLAFTINPLPNPVPALSSLSPTSATAGGAAFTLTVTGSNFVSNSVARWNGASRPTTYVSGTQLTAAIPASDIAGAGTAQVTVFNPAPAGGASSALAFTINPAPNPVPAITAVSPATANAGGPAFTLTVTGSNFVSGSVVRWNGADRPTTFATATQLRATISAADIASAGTAQVTVFNPAPAGGTSNAVTFTIRAVPVVNPGGVVNGGSFGNQPPAGAAIASIFGLGLANATVTAQSLPLPTTLGNVSVTVAGIAAPLFFVSPLQINFQLPWELLGQSQASVVVTLDGVASAAQAVNLANVSPGLFSVNQRGTGQGAILIAATGELAATGGSIPGRASRPASSGEHISIYATGLGAVSNPPATGAAAGSSPLSFTTATPTVTIGGLAAQVTFSGLAPRFVGLYQINVQVPESVTAAADVPVVVTIGGVTSNTVTIAVQ